MCLSEIKSIEHIFWMSSAAQQHKRCNGKPANSEITFEIDSLFSLMVSNAIG